jgi:hypothetical protein
MCSQFHTAGWQTHVRRRLKKFSCPGFVQPWLTRNCEMKRIFQRLQARRQEPGTTLAVWKLRNVTSGIWFQLCPKILSQAVRLESLPGHRLNWVSLWVSSAPPVLYLKLHHDRSSPHFSQFIIHQSWHMTQFWLRCWQRRSTSNK